MKVKTFLADLRRLCDKKMVAAAAAVAGVAGSLLPGYCDANLDASMNKFLEQMWKVLTFAGIIMAALGVASLVRTIGSIASGEQAQPGALGKGVGLLLGGIALAALKTLLGVLGISATV